MSQCQDGAVDVLEVKHEKELGQNLTRVRKKIDFCCWLKHLFFSRAGALMLKAAG